MCDADSGACDPVKSHRQLWTAIRRLRKKNAWNLIAEMLSTPSIYARLSLTLRRELAIAFVEIGNLNAARDEYENLLVTSNCPPGWHLELAECLIQIDEEREGEEIIRTLLREAGPEAGALEDLLDEVAAICGLRGLEMAQNWLDAHSVLQAGVEASQRAQKSAERLAKAGRWVDVSQALAEGWEAGDLQVDALLLLADAFERCGELGRASEAVTSASRQMPDSADVHFLLGRLLERSEDYQGAVREYRMSLTAGLSEEERARRCYRLAMVSGLAGDFQAGCRVLQESPRPTHSTFYWDLTSTSLARGGKLWIYRVIRSALRYSGAVLPRTGQLVVLQWIRERLPNPGDTWLHIGLIKHLLEDRQGRDAALDKAQIAFTTHVHGYPVDRGWTKKALRACITELHRAPDRGLAVLVALAGIRGGQLREAEEGLTSLIQIEPTLWWSHLLIADVYRVTGRTSAAAESLQAALERIDRHEPQLQRQLGDLRFDLRRYEEAWESYAMMEIYRTPYGISENRVARTPAARTRSRYAEYRKSLDIRDDCILYESFAGSKIACNPYALYLHLIDNPYFKDFTHIWVLNDRETASPIVLHHSNTLIVGRRSDAYLRHLASAKWLVNNSSFPGYFVRRSGQRYLNTWHGTPQKILGRHGGRDRDVRGTTGRNLLQATHVISSNAHTTYALLDGYAAKGALTADVLEAGYPRIDVTLAPGPARLEAIRRHLGLDAGDFVILFAPTWRSTESGIASVADEREVLQALDALPGKVLFRGHHFVSEDSSDTGSVIDVPSSIDTNELLALVDVLVTDFSSIYVDFAVLRRPIIHYVPDLDEYESSRGLYFGPERMPGEVVESLEGLVRVVKRLHSSAFRRMESVQSSTYLEFVADFLANEDGRATARVVDWFFAEDDVTEPRTRESGGPYWVSLSGPIPTGLAVLERAHAYRQLGAISSGTVLIDKRFQDLVHLLPMEESSPSGHIQALRHLEGCGNILGYSPSPAHTLDEIEAISAATLAGTFLGPSHRSLVLRALKRELQRALGTKPIDVLVVSSDSPVEWMVAALGDDIVRRVLLTDPWSNQMTAVRSDLLATEPGVARLFWGGATDAPSELPDPGGGSAVLLPATEDPRNRANDASANPYSSPGQLRRRLTVAVLTEPGAGAELLRPPSLLDFLALVPEPALSFLLLDVGLAGRSRSPSPRWRGSPVEGSVSVVHPTHVEEALAAADVVLALTDVERMPGLGQTLRAGGTPILGLVDCAGAIGGLDRPDGSDTCRARSIDDPMACATKAILGSCLAEVLHQDVRTEALAAALLAMPAVGLARQSDAGTKASGG